MDRQYEKYRSKMSAIEVHNCDPLLDIARSSKDDGPGIYDYEEWQRRSDYREQLENGYSNIDFKGGRGAYLKADDPRFTGND